MNKATKWIIGIIVVVVVIVIGYAVSKNSGTTGPIQIGFIGPLTGDAANVGQNAKAATEIAVKEVNDAGGINGRPLEVIYEDGQCSGKPASDAANKLININKVPVILGGACSGETSAFANAAEQSKTVTLSYCSSAPSISQAGDYIFRDYPSDSFQGKFAAEYVYNTLHKTKVAVLYAKTDWSSGINDVFMQEFPKLGGTVVADEGYDQTSRDLRTQLTKIKSANPDLIYFLGYTEASIPGIKQARDLGITAPLFGGDAWDDATIWSSVGNAGEGAMYVKPFSPLSDAFKASMQQETSSSEVTICSPQAYDGVKILAEVMRQAGTNATAIKDALYKVDYTGGVSSPEIRFDENGDLKAATYAVMKVHNGVATQTQ